MSPDVVVDIGNTRVKWGRGDPLEAVSLPPDDLAAWHAQAAAWRLGAGSRWAVGGVNPATADRLVGWVESIGGTCHVFRKPSDLPIRLSLDEPDAVGIDRVFGALAARSLVPPRTPAVTVDVGTAVTVNLVDADGVFRGGAIFPGPRLMGLALRDYTAKLPLVDVTDGAVDAPGTNTVAAIRLGIGATVVAGVHSLICHFADLCPAPPLVFITGGASAVLDGYRTAGPEPVHEPALNLLGVRIAAEALS